MGNHHHHDRPPDGCTGRRARRKPTNERQCGACGDPTTVPDPPWWETPEGHALCLSCRDKPQYRSLAEDYAREHGFIVADSSEPPPDAPYHDDDAAVLLRIWDALLVACGVQPCARREALHRLARRCPALCIEGGRHE